MCMMPDRPLFILFKNIGSFQRPFTKQLITDFSFWGLSNDLYHFLEFLKETKGFKNVQIGNKNFSMKTGDENLDHLNHEALMRLLKKSQNVQINRIEKTFEILEFIGANVDCLQHLESIHVEIQVKYIQLLKNICGLKNLTKLSLVQAYYDKSKDHPTTFHDAAVSLVTNIP